MSKRVFATSLWFLTGWVVGSTIVAFNGTTPIVAPALAILAAAVVAWDPAGRLWAH